MMTTSENFEKLMDIIFVISDAIDLNDKQHQLLCEIMVKHVKPTFDSQAELTKEKYALRYEINALKDELAMYKSLAKHGKIYASIDSTDCDMVSTYNAYSFDSVDEYNEWLECVYESAEGRTYINLISRDEYENFMPSTRDRILEAYENGNGYNVII